MYPTGPVTPEPESAMVVEVLDYGAFADLLIARFYVGEPPRHHRRFPGETVQAAVVREVRSPGRMAAYTEYECLRSPCGGTHPVAVVVADHWLRLALARRLECPCGRVARIEIFGRPDADYL